MTYTDADVQAAFKAIGCVPVTRERLGDTRPLQECRRHQNLWPCSEGVQLVEDVLDAVAQPIAARALREAASDVILGVGRKCIGGHMRCHKADASALRDRADEIEAGR